MPTLEFKGKHHIYTHHLTALIRLLATITIFVFHFLHKVSIGNQKQIISVIFQGYLVLHIHFISVNMLPW